MVEKLLNHVNPYTGMAWKDDPAFYALCPLNEDPVINCWNDNPEMKDIYLKKFDKWIKEKSLQKKVAVSRDVLFRKFLIETKLRSNRKMRDFFEKIGVKSLITGSNYISSMPQTFMRSEFDFVDNHSYWDHPTFPVKQWRLPNAYKMQSVIRSFCRVPRRMMPSRIFGDRKSVV